MHIRHIVIGQQCGDVQVDVHTGIEWRLEIRLSARAQGIDRTAKQLGIGTATLYRKLKKYGTR